ncbi:multiple epidermal growth factor-like domains protein 10, partial [Saccostrea cucullata]
MKHDLELQVNKTNNLSEGKTATQSRTATCFPPCGPDKVIDGDRETCAKDVGIGKGSSVKSIWWTVDLGSKHSIYSISIYFKDYKEYGDFELRQRGRFAGFSLYISNTQKKEDGYLCYKNTLPLPPLEFNTTCIEHGRYVIYYNERLDGVTYPGEYQIQSIYTELCEVKVEGCGKGFHGNNCNTPCPINCQEQRCSIVNGTCFDCTQGYAGEMCEKKCESGFYGLECKRQCKGHCIRNTPCNHVTGNCDEGCAAGWIGMQCDQ